MIIIHASRCLNKNPRYIVILHKQKGKRKERIKEEKNQVGESSRKKYSCDSRIITIIFRARENNHAIIYKTTSRLEYSKNAIIIKYYAFEEENLVKNHVYLFFFTGKIERIVILIAIYARNFAI